MTNLFSSIARIFRRPGSAPLAESCIVSVTVKPVPTPPIEDEYDPSKFWFKREEFPRKVDARLTLDYESTSGKRTTRDVDVRAFYRGDGGCIMDCFCHLRNAKRTLSSKCVRNAIDRDTGNPVGNIYAFLEEKYNKNPLKPYDEILEAYYWAILVLGYVAAADGAVRAPERRLIAEFCVRRGNPSELKVEEFETMVGGGATKYEFHRYIRERSATPEVMRDIMATAKAIVATNAEVYTEEERALAYMQDKWKQYLASEQTA